MRRITFLPSVPDILRSNSYHVSSHQKMMKVRTKRDHWSNKETRMIGPMIPALKRQKEYCQLFQGSPVPSLNPVTHTHKPSKETNKHKMKGKKKRKNVQRRSVEI